MNKKTPLRQCIGCGESKAKKELIRIVRTPEGEIHADASGKMNGRGAYICNDPACLEKAVTTRSLNRAFKMNVERDVIEALRKEMGSLG